MTRNEYTVDELADVLLRAGFVECNIAACNCGSWHHRYGLPERFSEIKDALMDAGVLNNETGNLPIRAIAKLVEQRDALRSRLAEAERDSQRLDWLERHLFEGRWDGTIGRPKSWHMAGPYRHTLQRMRGDALREAIDLAMRADSATHREDAP